jgi:hypothetical protein
VEHHCVKGPGGMLHIGAHFPFQALSTRFVAKYVIYELAIFQAPNKAAQMQLTSACAALARAVKSDKHRGTHAERTER